MGDIDNTRNRLKLDNLKQDDRRNLFNKFVDAGGEVITNRKKQTTLDYSSSFPISLIENLGISLPRYSLSNNPI